MGDVLTFPSQIKPPRHRFRVGRPIPVFERGKSTQTIVAPGSRGWVTEEYDGSGVGVPRRNRAVVEFDGIEGEFDVSRDSLEVF
jgi:hypothetical protein